MSLKNQKSCTVLHIFIGYNVTIFYNLFEVNLLIMVVDDFEINFFDF